MVVASTVSRTTSATLSVHLGVPTAIPLLCTGTAARHAARKGSEMKTDAVINLALLRADISGCAVAPGFVG
jgi:hypothetical protein